MKENIPPPAMSVRGRILLAVLFATASLPAVLKGQAVDEAGPAGAGRWRFALQAGFSSLNASHILRQERMRFSGGASLGGLVGIRISRDMEIIGRFSSNRYRLDASDNAIADSPFRMNGYTLGARLTVSCFWQRACGSAGEVRSDVFIEGTTGKRTFKGTVESEPSSSQQGTFDFRGRSIGMAAGFVYHVARMLDLTGSVGYHFVSFRRVDVSTTGYHLEYGMDGVSKALEVGVGLEWRLGQ